MLQLTPNTRNTSKLLLWYFIILIFLPTNYALSSEQFPKEFKNTTYGSIVHFERVPNALFYIGEVDKNDSFKFRKALRNHNIEIVVLGGPGGSVWEGLQIAGIISDNRLVTYIPKDFACFSACSFMFFGGSSTRLAEGDLGVHQFYSNSTIGDMSQTQCTISEIIGFLNEFNTPSFVFEKMFSESEMYFFSDSEKAKINTISISDSKYQSKFQDIDNLILTIARKIDEEQKADEDLANIEKDNEIKQEKKTKSSLSKQGHDSLRSAYVLAIKQKIERNWRQPQEAGKMPDCEVRVLQGPGGIILDVSFGRCAGGFVNLSKVD